LTPELSELKKRIENALLENPFTPPGPKEITDLFGKQSDPIIAHMLESGELVRIEAGVLLHRDALEMAAEKIRKYLSKVQKATVSDLKSHLGTTRKYAVPLLTYFDTSGLTERDGDYRKLRE
jgi:selenocysteine-specific elongation factor